MVCFGPVTLQNVVGVWVVDPADPILRTEFGDVTMIIDVDGEVLYMILDPGATLELHAHIVEHGGRLWLEGQPGVRSPITLTPDGKMLLDDGDSQCVLVRVLT